MRLYIGSSSVTICPGAKGDLWIIGAKNKVTGHKILPGNVDHICSQIGLVPASAAQRLQASVA